MNIAEIKKYNEHSLEAENTSFKNDMKTQTERKPMSFSQILDELQANGNSSAIVSQGLENSAFAGQGRSLTGLSSNPVSATHLPGDYISSFKIENPVVSDFESPAKGMAAGFGKSGGTVLQANTVDKTCKLYEQALELESYFVKMMLDSMRKTLSGKTLSGDESFAGKMYNDMMYEELGRNITKNAGFGLADQIYLEFYRSK